MFMGLASRASSIFGLIFAASVLIKMNDVDRSSSGTVHRNIAQFPLKINIADVTVYHMLAHFYFWKDTQMRRKGDG